MHDAFTLCDLHAVHVLCLTWKTVVEKGVQQSWLANSGLTWSIHSKTHAYTDQYNFSAVGSQLMNTIIYLLLLLKQARALPTQRRLNSKPLSTVFSTSWSGSESNPTWSDRSKYRPEVPYDANNCSYALNREASPSLITPGSDCANTRQS